MRAVVLGAVAVGVAVATAFAVLRLGDDASTPLPESGARTAASVEPRHHLFGDTVRAQVDVVLDRDRIDPETVTLRSSFEPYEHLGAATLERADLGGQTRLRWMFRLVCLDDTCMPDGPESVHTFAPAVVLAGGRQVAEIDWPHVAVSSRIAPQSRSTASRSWSLGAGDVPLPTFRITPDAAVLVLAVLAAVLAGVGAILLGIALRRPSRAPLRVPPLERALALLDTARRDDLVHEERKALDLLAVELSRAGEGELAQRVTELAWARERPAADATDRVTERVGELLRSRNGTHA